MQGRDNIAKDGSSASTLKAIDGELIGIALGAVSLLPLTTSSHAVTDNDCDALLSLHSFQSDNA
jgi:predicted metal-dependent HD superfamily phosphohydrolase